MQAEEKPKIPDPYFVDIESVPVVKDFPEGTPLGDLFLKHFKHELEKKINQLEIETPLEYVDRVARQALWDQKAGITAEYGKIICISVGKVIHGKTGVELHIKTLFNLNEQVLLIQFREILMNTKNPDTITLCAHNGKEFDFPFLLRRMIINKVIIPSVLDTMFLKPWEVRLLDTMEMWSGTQWKHKASLPILTELFGLESPKTDMDGSQVAEVYFSIFKEDTEELPFDKEERIKAAIKRITDYCPADVFALVNVFCRMRGLNIITPEQVFYAI